MPINEKIGEIFDFIPETNLTEDYFYEHKGSFPVFSGQTDELGIVTYIDSYNQSGDCTTVTTYGNNAGKLYFRTGNYTIGRNCMGIKPKDKYKSEINMKWFSFKFQGLFYKLRIGDPDGQRSLNRMLIENFKISIPSSHVQERQLKLYEKTEKLKQRVDQISMEMEQFLKSKIAGFKTIHHEKIGIIFTLEGGNSGLTEEFVYHNRPSRKTDAISILSGATIQDNTLGSIQKDAILENGNPLKIYSSPTILVIRKGSAGSMRYIDQGEFTTNDDAYVMIVNPEWKDKIDLRWFSYQYQELFRNLVTSKSDNATFSKEYVEEQYVSLPDIKHQQKIADNLHKLDTIIQKLKDLKKISTDLMECEIVECQ
ncbi:MAG: restriction endonuclease subunit S [Thaumarchaeota archaeon]|nr:restriction endonuclease subunit S [Nitrososphaerota archaeon]